MPVTYNTVQDPESVNLPYWQYDWIGSGGCTNQLHIESAASLAPATNQISYYEPYEETVVKDNRKINGRTNTYPPYRMTPRYVSKSIVRRYLLRRKNASNGYNRFLQYGTRPFVGGICTNAVSLTEISGPLAPRWTEVTHLFPYTEYKNNQFDMTEVNDAVLQAQDDASTEALTSYDFLTDLAEGREIPQLVTSVSRDIINILRILRGRFPLASLRKAAFINPHDLLKHPDKVLRKLGDEWMQYRYGIMPLVYSYRDLMKTMNRGVVESTHRRIMITPYDLNPTLPSPTSRYIWSNYVGDIRVSATVFQHFPLDPSGMSVARSAGIGLNPLVTLWELIPYSFVVDWFVNVGDYILRKTSQAGSRTIMACCSLRSSYSKQYWAHFPNEDKTITFGHRYSTPWVGSYPPATPSEVIKRPEERQLFKEEIVDSYDRWGFSVSDARLYLKPNLNWKRLIDAGVMSLTNLGNLIRFLKGK